MADHVITFPKVNLGVNNSELQLIITFTVTGSAVSWDADDKGIFVMQYGETSWRYDLDNPLLTPGTQDIVIHDRDDYLSHLFFSEDSTEDNTEKRGKVELYLDDVLEFSGTILEDSIYYDVAEKLLKFSAANELDLLNKEPLYYDVESGSGIVKTEYNPMGYSKNIYYPLQTIIEDIFQILDSSLSVSGGGITIKNTLKFAGFHTTDLVTATPRINNITVNASSVTIEPTVSPPVVSDGDTVLIYGVSGITDLNNKEWTVSNTTGTTFDVDLTTSQSYISGGVYDGISISSSTDLSDIYARVNPFYFDPDLGFESCGDLLRELAIELVSFAGILPGNKAFFMELFKFDSSNTQSLGTVLSWRKSYKKKIYDMVRVESSLFSNDEHTIYKAGKETGIQDNKLEVSETLTTAYHQLSGDDSVTDNSSSVAEITNLEYNDGTQRFVYAVKNENFENLWHDSGYIQAYSWYDKRGNIVSSRIDVFEVVGVDYDFLKNFVYDGKRYQIVSLKKHWEQGKSEIEAIYLGLDV